MCGLLPLFVSPKLCEKAGTAGGSTGNLGCVQEQYHATEFDYSVKFFACLMAAGFHQSAPQASVSVGAGRRSRTEIPLGRECGCGEFGVVRGAPLAPTTPSSEHLGTPLEPVSRRGWSQGENKAFELAWDHSPLAVSRSQALEFMTLF